MTDRHSARAAERLCYFAADEVALLGEMVVDRGVDRAEFLQGLHPAEAGHCPLASSEGAVAVLNPVVLPTTDRRLQILGAQILQRGGAQSIGDDCLGPPVTLQRFLDEFQRRLTTPAGANVSPLEVEAVLVSYPEVREALVFGLPDPGRGQAVAAAIVPEPGSVFDAEALRRRLKGDLSAYKVPTIYVELAAEDVPRTDTGKPKKELVAQRVLAQRTAARGA